MSEREYYITHETSGACDVYTVFSIKEGTMRKEFSPGKYSTDHCISRLYNRAFHIRKTKDFPRITEETLDTLKQLSSAYRTNHDQSVRHGLIEGISEVLDQYSLSSLDEICVSIKIYMITHSLCNPLESYGNS